MVIKSLNLPKESVAKHHPLIGTVKGKADMVGKSQIKILIQLFSQRCLGKADNLIGQLNPF